MNDIQNGYYAVGVMHAVTSTPWSTDNTRFNHKVVLANPFVDSNGFKQTEVISIDISADDLTRLQGLSNELNGKKVLISCVFSAKKGGRSGAWLSKFMPKGSPVTVLAN